jgi:hypothetical protein
MSNFALFCPLRAFIRLLSSCHSLPQLILLSHFG